MRTLTLLLLLAGVASAQTATPIPADRECLPFIVGITRCGDLCTNGRRYRLRDCPELEMVIMDERSTPTPRPTARPTPQPTSPRCPATCPAGTRCSQVNCDAFGECSCR